MPRWRIDAVDATYQALAVAHVEIVVLPGPGGAGDVGAAEDEGCHSPNQDAATMITIEISTSDAQ